MVKLLTLDRSNPTQSTLLSGPIAPAMVAMPLTESFPPPPPPPPLPALPLLKEKASSATELTEEDEEVEKGHAPESELA